jgi:hypothetical protein
MNTWTRTLQAAAVAATLALGGVHMVHAAGPKAKAAAVQHDHSGPGGEPAHAGRLVSDAGISTDYAQNAVQRCAVFKTPEDRRACAERVRQPSAVDGSVSGGGELREYSYQVQVPAPAAQ